MKELTEEHRKRLAAEIGKHGDWASKTYTERNDAAAKAVRDAGIEPDPDLYIVAYRNAIEMINCFSKAFDLNHVLGIKLESKNCEWTDWAHKIPFVGRNAFFEEVQEKLNTITPMKGRNSRKTDDHEEQGGINTSVQVEDAELTLKESFAIVYSSVQGTGKTVSMLRLKERLQDTAPDVHTVVAYLGFNTKLLLTDGEKFVIHAEGLRGAEKVLARRLVASTIISHNNGNAITHLPHSKDVYESYEIPPVENSLEMLLQYMKNSKIKNLAIIAGVDEVQFLNKTVPGIASIGLGRYFLRTLRTWQVEWKRQKEMNIYLLPLGTGVELHWREDQTTGDNRRIHGPDSTLITKPDFKELTTTVIEGMDVNEFNNKFGCNTTRRTVIENVSAFYWPRVRLLQWLVEGKEDKLTNEPRHDANHVQWHSWLSKWMLDTTVDIESTPELAPGNGAANVGIKALFEWCGHGKLKVIPDGFAAPSILTAINKTVPMNAVYSRLADRFISLRPEALVPKDEYDFEDLGFDVVTTAIHLGIYTIRSVGDSTDSKIYLVNTATDVQKQRLGLAFWFAKHCPTLIDNRNPYVDPIVIGQGSISCTTPYFPFSSIEQDAFDENIVEHFKIAVKEKRPTYIRCGKNTCCDYMFFFVSAVDEGGTTKFLCNIHDAKHTSREVYDVSDPSKITEKDQTGLYQAATKVNTAVQAMGHTIHAVRLMFVTNRTSCVATNVERYCKAKTKVDMIWPNNNGLELLNKDTFDFGPFSDILMARRHGPKRKLPQDEPSSGDDSFAPSTPNDRKRQR